MGDSYTYGDEVLDEESWPAQLQKLTGRRVLNGGVTGYGFDQIVLRAEKLVRAHKPSTVILAFISDDIARTEMRSMWWRSKPWFAIEGDELVLKGIPVPDRTRLPLGIRRRTEPFMLGLPWFVQSLLGYHSRIHQPGYGLAIAQRLVERFAKFCTEHRIKAIILAQYEPSVWSSRTAAAARRRTTAAILDCAAAHGLGTLDTYPRFAGEPAPLSFYGFSHMNSRGNRTIAVQLAATLPALLAGQRRS